MEMLGQELFLLFFPHCVNVDASSLKPAKNSQYTSWIPFIFKSSPVRGLLFYLLLVYFDRNQ